MAEQQTAGCAALRCGRVDGRLFLGLGGASPLETAVTLHHSYGVPLLPGSALKGLARAYAAPRIDVKDSEVLFGRAPDSEAEDSGEAGYVIFHDAWWIPESSATPLAPEIVTVHYPGYYANQGQQTPASDFDSPVPNAQVAVRGSFFFAVEALDGWADYAMDILWKALQYEGAGAKTAAGYGYFVPLDEPLPALLQTLIDQVKQANRIPDEKINDVWRGQPLAKAWSQLPEGRKKAEIKAVIIKVWQNNQWWNNPQGAAKKAKAIYDGI